MVLSIRSRTTAAAPALEASDQIGDSPDFGSRRGPSQASDSSSLRSRTSLSMKRFFSSPRRKGSQDTAPAPVADAPKSTTNNGASTKTVNPLYPGKAAAAAPKPAPVLQKAAPALAAPAATGGSLLDAVNDSVVGSLTSETTASGPRPSELFAGKGVQWNQIDLTSGRDLSSAPDAATHPVDLQKFLKERRQWIPTFADDSEQDAAQTDAVVLPKKLDQLSFDGATSASAATASAGGGLKSLRDLEDTHKRKAALLPGATEFEEPGAAGATLSPSGSAASTSKMGVAPVLPPPPAAPARNQSFRTSTFSADSTNAPLLGRTSGSLSRKQAPAIETDTTQVPHRRSSMHRQASATSQPRAALTPDAPASPPAAKVSGEAPPRPPRNGSRTPSRQNSTDALNKSAASSTLASVPDTAPVAPDAAAQT